MKQYRKIETNENKKTIKRTVTLMAVLILIGITVLVGTSYALFSTTLHGEKKVSIQTGTFQVEMTDGEYIKEESMGTLTDKEGKKTKPYTFTITNASTETIGAYYRLYLTEESGNLNTYYLKYELKGNDGSQKEGRIGTLSSFYIYKYLESKESITYELRLWLDEETPNSEQGKNYQSKIAVEGSQVKFPTAAETLLIKYANPENAEFSDVTKDKMFVFHHEVGAQQEGWSKEELTDYRYIGVNPNNYVTFNGEEAGWRIIGIFTVENEKGEKEKRIKLVKKDYIGNMVWDSADENDWSRASLMRQINPDTGETIFHLTRESQEMIGDTKWYLGATTWRNYYYDKGLTSNFYLFERGKEVYEGNSTYWIGKVGLMYVSDYGYATSGGSVTSQKSCLETKIYNWDSESISDCKNNDWLYSGKGQWTLVSRSEMGKTVISTFDSGGVGDYCGGTNCHAYARPVVFLASAVELLKGTGSKDDPFVFSK